MTVKINNEDYYVKFGFKALMEFEKMTGIKFTELSSGISLQTIADLAFIGLKAGAEAEGNKFSKSKAWVIDALDTEEGLFQDIMQAFNNSSLGKKSTKKKA